jgi:hypothetical protein
VEAVDALRLLTLLLRHGQAVVGRDPFDHEHAVALEDLADGLDLIPLRIDFDLTRFQRAGKGARQSATGRGDDIVERRGVRRKLLGIDAVVLGDLGVDPEGDRVALRG